MRELKVYTFNNFEDYWIWKKENEEFREKNLNVDDDGRVTVGVIIYGK